MSPQSVFIGENSILECLQIITLLFAALCAHLAGYFVPSRSTLSSLLVAAACIACVREFDFVLDRYLFDGAWQLLVFMIILISIIRAWQHREGLKGTIHDFLQRPSFGVMVGGFLTVFVFSRLIGRKVLWIAIMGDGYMGVVKTAVEESTELLGYALIFIGTLEYLREAILAGEKVNLSTTDVALTPHAGESRIAPIQHSKRQGEVGDVLLKNRKKRGGCAGMRPS